LRRANEEFVAGRLWGAGFEATGLIREGAAAHELVAAFAHHRSGILPA
jgi:hypothetical protein